MTEPASISETLCKALQLTPNHWLLASIVISWVSVEIFYNPSKKYRVPQWQTIGTLLAVSLCIFITNSFQLNYVIALLLALAILFSNKQIFGLLTHPSEFPSLISYFMAKTPQMPRDLNEDQTYCFKKLAKVSRSFNSVILALDEKLREPVCLFYLVCRAIDTIEDDMKANVEEKIDHLRKFYTHLENNDGFKLAGFGDVPAEIDLLEKFDVVLAAFEKIEPQYKPIIIDIANKMGNGMADYLKKKVITLEDYDLYCWYVAGLVGEGLSQLFAASGLESQDIEKNSALYKSMGLYLQKVNITRDYLEDVTQSPPRIFYPKAIWGKYAKNVADFTHPENIGAGVLCLNEMVTNAMQHACDVIDYLDQIKVFLIDEDESIFRFCAIPQTMAIATLYECYNNPDVFTGESKWFFWKVDVKVRKTLALKMIMNSNNMSDVLNFFNEFVLKIEAEVPESDPSAKQMKRYINNLKKKIINHPHFDKSNIIVSLATTPFPGSQGSQ